MEGTYNDEEEMTADTDAGPASYSLENLLSQTVQPFPDLPPDEFEVMKESIRTRGLLNKIQLTADGYLWDGHQRCKAMVALGRTRISAKDVVINPKITRDNMLGAAMASNTVRRMQTTADRADRMHKLAAMGWSQRKIARELGMKQPSVSELMKKYPPAEGTPDVIITEGEDGKTYARKRESKPSVRYAAWEYKGSASKLLMKAQATMKTLTASPFNAIDAERARAIRWMATEVADAAMALVRRIDNGEYGMDAAKADPEDGDDE